MLFKILSLILLVFGCIHCKNEEGNGDFADFEDFGDDDDFATVSTVKEDSTSDRITADIADHHLYQTGDEGSIDTDSEFDHFTDEEEFEGFDKETTTAPILDQKTGEPKLTVAKVPLHFGTHWKSYWLEMVMIAGLIAYFTNYVLGRNRNTKLATLWLKTHRSLLDENFSVIGSDDPLHKEREVPDGSFVKESESVFTLWCSGRICCEGMLVELKLIRRQDLVAIIADLMKPSRDQLHIKIELTSDAMETFVFCVATKRTASRLFKEMYDLNKFCNLVTNPESKYNVPSGFSVLSEINEASSAMLDSRVTALLSKYSSLIDYIYITDQYNGVITQEEPCLKMPEVKKHLLLGFNLPKNNSDMDKTKPLMSLVFYMLEKIKRYRISREGKLKADKNRQRVEEEFSKSTHAARAEAAALRREEKRKLEKERVMAEEDPEKQRRWEKKEQKRQQKRNAPKMKQLSVKAL